MDMMKAILDIENKAQEIENSIERFASDIKQETDREIEKFSQNAQAEIDVQINKFRETIKEIEEKEYNSTKAEMKEALDFLEEKYTANREKWINEITAEVTKGD